MTTNDEIIQEFREFVEGQLVNLQTLMLGGTNNPSYPSINTWFPHNDRHPLRKTLHDEWWKVVQYWEIEYITYQTISQILYNKREKTSGTWLEPSCYNWLTTREANLLIDVVGDLAKFLGTNDGNLLFYVDCARIVDGGRRGFEAKINQIIQSLKSLSEIIATSAMLQPSTEQSGYEE